MFSNKSLDRLFEKTSATISFSSTSIEDSLVLIFQLFYLIGGIGIIMILKG